MNINIEMENNNFTYKFSKKDLKTVEDYKVILEIISNEYYLSCYLVTFADDDIAEFIDYVKNLKIQNKSIIKMYFTRTNNNMYMFWEFDKRVVKYSF